MAEGHPERVTRWLDFYAAQEGPERLASSYQDAPLLLADIAALLALARAVEVYLSGGMSTAGLRGLHAAYEALQRQRQEVRRG